MENMGVGKMKGNRGLIHKTWERCRSFGGSSSSAKKFAKVAKEVASSKPRSWPCSPESSAEEEDKRTNSKTRRRGRVVPEGCFSIYVGPERQRFVIKTECINHPLFKMLLEEAELEYGYCEGPLVLPCEVDFFYKVLAEMDGDEIRQGCSFAHKAGGYGSSSYRRYSLVSPSRLVAVDHF